jgi:hypothetical protein
MIATTRTFIAMSITAVLTAIAVPVGADAARVSLELRFRNPTGALVDVRSLTMKDVDGTIVRGGPMPGRSAVELDRASQGIEIVAETALGTCRLHVFPQRFGGGVTADFEIHPGKARMNVLGRMVDGYPLYDGYATFCELRHVAASSDPILRYSIGG